MDDIHKKSRHQNIVAVRHFTYFVIIISGLFPLTSSRAQIHFDEVENKCISVSAYNPIVLRNYRIIFSLDPSSSERTYLSEGYTLTLLSGKPYTFDGHDVSCAGAYLDEEKIVFRITGLSLDKSYAIGFTWWDSDWQDRTQSLAIFKNNSEPAIPILPAAPAAAFLGDKSTPARIVLPIPNNFIKDTSTLTFSFEKVSGPNVGLQEFVLFERVSTHHSRKVLLITGDDYAGHHWRKTSLALAKALLEDTSMEVIVTESPSVLASPWLDYFDVIILHFKNYSERLPLDKECQNGLRDFLGRRKGVVLTHFACGAFQEWDGFEQIAGRVWNPSFRAHDPYGTFTVRVIDKNHPVSLGMEDFEVTDELYTCLDGTTSIRVLCEAVSSVDSKSYPIAFVLEPMGGRVFHCVLGHDAGVYQVPGVRQLVQRGVTWAAGSKSEDEGRADPGEN